MRSLPGLLELIADAHGTVTVLSPTEVAVSSAAIEAFDVGLANDVDIEAIEVAGRGASDEAWQTLARTGAQVPEWTPAGRIVRMALSSEPRHVDQLRLTLRLARNARLTLSRVAVLRR